jgi:hypothetical protein
MVPHGGASSATWNTRTSLESFVVTSWAEHLRQHDRITQADSELEQRVRSHAVEEPIVRHLIFARPEQ